MEKFDVVVVGAGPGGSSAAKKCVDGGLKTLLIDRRKLPRRKACSGIIDNISQNYVFENFGPIPENMSVCHKCDNPGCVNPDHLFLGTHQENMKDASNKDRMSTWKRLNGEEHGRAKLTRVQVLSIKEDTRPRKEIALEYGVSLSRVSKIKQGVTWNIGDDDD